ncbi:MAG: STAS domain-containing protein [Bryobacteraceae bacterium]
MTPPTKVTLDNEGALAVLRFQGDITSASKDVVLGAYEQVSKDHVQNILLDFSKVSYLNSSGIALVIQMLMEANRSGQKVQIFGLTPHFQKVFTMVGLTKYTALHPDEVTAKAAFAG